MTKKPRKKNPQDATFRNINALKRRVAELESRIGIGEHHIADLADRVARICEDRRIRVPKMADQIANLATAIVVLEDWTRRASDASRREMDKLTKTSDAVADLVNRVAALEEWTQKVRQSDFSIG